MNTYYVNVSGVFECTRTFQANTQDEALAQAREYFENQTEIYFNIDNIEVESASTSYTPVRDLFSHSQQEQSTYNPLNRS